MVLSAHNMLLAGLACVAMTLTAPLPAAAQNTNPVVGTWRTEKGDATVRVTTCGSGICGKVVGLREPIDPDTGRPAVDNKNPNPALAQRPIIGLNLFNDMRETSATTWAGRIYNADDGQFYASKVAIEGPSRLRVEGCVGAICGGEIWTKVSR